MKKLNNGLIPNTNSKSNNGYFQRGSIYIVKDFDFGTNAGTNREAKTRPCIILNDAIGFGQVLVAPCSLSHYGLPVHSFDNTTCYLQVNDIAPVAFYHIGDYLGYLQEEDMARVDEALAWVCGISKEIPEFMANWESAAGTTRNPYIGRPLAGKRIPNDVLNRCCTNLPGNAIPAADVRKMRIILKNNTLDSLDEKAPVVSMAEPAGPKEEIIPAGVVSDAWYALKDFLNETLEKGCEEDLLDFGDFVNRYIDYCSTKGVESYRVAWFRKLCARTFDNLGAETIHKKRRIYIKGYRIIQDSANMAEASEKDSDDTTENDTEIYAEGSNLITSLEALSTELGLSVTMTQRLLDAGYIKAHRSHPKYPIVFSPADIALIQSIPEMKNPTPKMRFTTIETLIKRARVKKANPNLKQEEMMKFHDAARYIGISAKALHLYIDQHMIDGVLTRTVNNRTFIEIPTKSVKKFAENRHLTPLAAEYKGGTFQLKIENKKSSTNEANSIMENNNEKVRECQIRR